MIIKYIETEETNPIARLLLLLVKHQPRALSEKPIAI